jgi:hypothetical protein
MQEIKVMVEGEVIHTLRAKNSIFCLFVSKALMSQYLFNEDGNNLVEVVKGKQLNNVMDKFIPLKSSNIFNFITSFRHYPTNRGYIDNILLLEFRSHYNYIQYNCF